MDYKILTAKGIKFDEAKQHLEEVVTNHFEQGWKFVGGISTSYDDISHTHYFAQAMARQATAKK